MRAITPETAEAFLADVMRPVVLLDLDWPSQRMRFHDNTNILNYGGHDWHGVGKLGAIGEIQEAVGIGEVQECGLELIAPPSEWAVIASTSRHARNRTAKIYLGALDDQFRGLMGLPLLLYEGQVRAAALKIMAEGEISYRGVVQITVQGHLAQVRRPKLRRVDNPYLAYLMEQIFEW